MSDNEGATKKSGYRLEYANSARAKCKGAKPCTGTPIVKGALRVGSIVDFKGNTSFAWRHWGCTTPKIISNMKEKFSGPEDLDGFENLKEEDQERVRRAWEEGHVADEDIPPSAQKAADAEDDAEKPKKKRAPAKKKAEAEGDDEAKPKKKRATKSKKAEEEDEDDEDEADDAEQKSKSAPAKKSRAKKHDEEDGEKRKGASRRQVAPKRAPVKKKVTKDESEGSGEDFAEELAEVGDEEDDDAEESAGKKRKRPASKQAPVVKKSRATASRPKKSKAVVEDEDDE